MFLKFSTKIIDQKGDKVIRMFILKERIISVSSIPMDNGKELAEICYLDADGIGRHVITEETFDEIASKL